MLDKTKFGRRAIDTIPEMQNLIERLQDLNVENREIIGEMDDSNLRKQQKR